MKTTPYFKKNIRNQLNRPPETHGETGCSENEDRRPENEDLPSPYFFLFYFIRTRIRRRFTILLLFVIFFIHCLNRYLMFIPPPPPTSPPC